MSAYSILLPVIMGLLFGGDFLIGNCEGETYSQTNPREKSSYEIYMAKYSRIYTQSRLGKFYYYRKLYFYHSRRTLHYIRAFKYYPYFCGNFEANELGDYMGYNRCPLFFEPLNFTYCCGEKYYNYCCDVNPRKDDDDESSELGTGIIVAIVFGILIFLGVIGGIIVLCLCGCTKRRPPPPRMSPGPSAPSYNIATTTTNAPGYFANPGMTAVNSGMPPKTNTATYPQQVFSVDYSRAGQGQDQPPPYPSYPMWQQTNS